MTASRPRFIVVVAPVALAILGMGLSIYGWSHEAKSPIVISDLIYKALRSIGLSELYADVGSTHDWPLDIARWIGAAVAFWAVLSLFYAGLRSTRIHLMVLLRRRHVVVVGDTPFADRLSEAARELRTEVVHLREGAVTEVDGELIRLPYIPEDPRALRSAQTRRARRLVIAVTDDARAANLAMAAQRQYPRLSVSTRMDDIWLARSLHSLPGAEKLRAFTEPNAAAREIVRRHPPYLIARDLGQARIHAVLIGDHDWLEALMVEIILSACTLTFGKPIFTCICTQPEDFRTRLLARYPDFEKACDLTLLEGRRSSHAPLAPSHPADLGGRAPVTAAYCALSEDAGSLSTALALRDIVLHDEGFTAPIFLRMGAQGMARPVPGSRLEPHAMVPFGSLSDLAHAAGIVPVRGEEAEKAWHRAYLSFAPDDRTAALAWEDLPEEFRTSNQRAVAHMYAKLFEAGFDLRTWLAGHNAWTELPALAKGEKLWRDATERTRLAELEHERWIADRRMSGWTGGPVRDNRRKIHDNIVPFDALTPEIQGYDYKFVDLLDKVLKRSKDGMRRPR